jgi:hypothetical protein
MELSNLEVNYVELLFTSVKPWRWAVVQYTVCGGFDDQDGHEKCTRAGTVVKSSCYFGRNEAVGYRDIELYALQDNGCPVEWSFYLSICVKANLEISPRGELLWSIL